MTRAKKPTIRGREPLPQVPRIPVSDDAPPCELESSRVSRWRFSKLNLAIALLLVAGVTLFIYPTSAAWISQYNQSNIVYRQSQENEQRAAEELQRLLADARTYNEQLGSAAILGGGANLAQGIGREGDALDYWDQLTSPTTASMARLKIPSIDLDLPVYHGTSDATLLKGVGHLQGTSLPVGGEGSRSVLTGHRGLANATMFTHLDRIEKGDTFTVEVLGEVLTYRVFKIEVVEPDATEEIRPVSGRDLVTLVTCTPLGINTQRILVTGERVKPTPQADLDAAGERPEVPRFPWWAVAYTAAVLLIGAWYWRSGRRPHPDQAT